MANVVVNAVGDQCPIPVVKATKALKAMTEAGTVEVHVDNEIAVQNLTRLASSKGLKSFAEKKEEKLFIVKITLDKPLEENGAEEEASCGVDRRKNTVVAIASERMGHGNDELGKVADEGLYLCSFPVGRASQHHPFLQRRRNHHDRGLSVSG